MRMATTTMTMMMMMMMVHGGGNELFSQFWSGLETVRTTSAVRRSSCSATQSDVLSWWCRTPSPSCECSTSCVMTSCLSGRRLTNSATTCSSTFHESTTWSAAWISVHTTHTVRLFGLDRSTTNSVLLQQQQLLLLLPLLPLPPPPPLLYWYYFAYSTQTMAAQCPSLKSGGGVDDRSDGGGSCTLWIKKNDTRITLNILNWCTNPQEYMPGENP